MVNVFFRTIIVFFAVLIVLRMLGKRQIGEMQPFELAITLIMADLACIPMSDVTIPLLYGILSILGLFLLHTIIILLNQKSMWLRRLLSGRPAIIITPKGIDFQMLKNLHMTLTDLEEALHTAGCFSFDQVQYGILETNGVLSVIKKSHDEPNPALPILLVSGGKINTSSLELIGQNGNIIFDILERHNIKSIKTVLILTIDNNGKIYLQEKYKQAITAKIENFKGGANW